MNRRMFVFCLSAFVLLLGCAFAVAQQSGTAAEARAMLDRGVAALNPDYLVTRQ